MAGLGRRLWRCLPFVQPSSLPYEALTNAFFAPPLFFLSPAQLWIGPLVSRVNKEAALEEEWLPQFSQSAAALRTVFGALRQQHGGIVPFVLQFEIGGMLLLGAILEIMSAVSALGAPLVLHSFLKAPESASLAAILVVVTLLATICGRAKDEVCRVHSAWVECMLRSVIFDKSFHLSPTSRISHPPAKVINVNAVDVSFLTNYVLKIHDVWSTPIQITGIALLTFGVMGWTSVFGFALVAIIFASQTRLGKRIGQSVGGYVRHNDSRLGAYRDMLNNIKGVKASGIEDVFQRKVTTARGLQLESLSYYLRTSFALFTAVNQTTPYLAACAAFLAYAISGAKLTSEVVFPCLAYFQMLYQPVTLASLAFSRQFSVRPSLGRVRELLDARESRMPLPEPGGADGPSAVSFRSASFEWPTNEKSNVVSFDVGDLEIPRAQMTTVIGPNGSGKTSFLRAMLGEMVAKSGTYHVHGMVAYCSQDPWVMSGTLRDNIVFNSPRGYEARRYADVVRACALDTDFAKIQGGTENASVGESGSNLSGGQRARVSLARAMYSDADILLLDDPLSALDAHVRAQLFDALRALTKTVILVTLHTSFLSRVDQVVVIDDHKTRWHGSKSDFLAQSWSSKYMSLEHTQPSKEVDNGTDKSVAKIGHQGDAALADEGLDDQDGGAVDNIWQEEERARGAVQLDVAKFYIRASGGMGYAVIVLAMTCLLTISKVLSQYWFVWWIADSINLSQSQYMGSFLGLTLFQGLVTAALGWTLVVTSMKAAKLVHEVILANLIAAPLWFFHQNPTGRILNRLSKDTEAMDSKIINAVDGLLGAGTTMFASVTIVASSGFFLFAAVIPFLLIVGWCLQRFRVTAREVQRLDAVLQSPTLSILTESLKAPSSARAYRAETFLVARHGQALDRLAAAKICRQSLDTWITFRAEAAAASVLLLLVLLTVNDVIPQVSASLALATATTLARNMFLLAWACTDLEIQLNAVERLQMYYDRIPREGNKSRLGSSRRAVDPNGWPSSSDIDIKGAYLKYKTRKTPALNNITLRFPGGQKVGLIGRTGSGKSTLISVLSRLVDIQDGTISIGGVNTAKIEPRQLRRSVITLPQESLIFQGTLRDNIDPHNRRSDRDIWDALDACQMSSVLRLKYGENALEQELSADGADLSAGQKQLLCAARVLLERPAVLLVDEASANVDFASDEALQRAWQALPAETTMITIAHRASSLAWMDRVLVMEDGNVVEDGTPRELLEQRGGQGRVGGSYYRGFILQDGIQALEKALQTAKL